MLLNFYSIYVSIVCLFNLKFILLNEIAYETVRNELSRLKELIINKGLNDKILNDRTKRQSIEGEPYIPPDEGEVLNIDDPIPEGYQLSPLYREVFNPQQVQNNYENVFTIKPDNNNRVFGDLINTYNNRSSYSLKDPSKLFGENMNNIEFINKPPSTFTVAPVQQIQNLAPIPTNMHAFTTPPINLTSLKDHLLFVSKANDYRITSNIQQQKDSHISPSNLFNSPFKEIGSIINKLPFIHNLTNPLERIENHTEDKIQELIPSKNKDCIECPNIDEDKCDNRPTCCQCVEKK